MYVNDIKNGYCVCNAVPYVIKESAATALVDGCEGLGPIVGHFCMELAIRKAKSTGVACVVAKGSNHYGIAGWYSRKALSHNMLGFTCSNSTPLMCPTRTNVAAVGSNPLSFAAPGKNGDSFVLDMATTASSFGKVEIQKVKEQPIPKGVALGEDGKETTNPEEAIRVHHLLPLGGTEDTAGYKGYGLGLMVETLCGILAGSDFGTKIASRLEDRPKKSLKSHFFLAIDPNCFALEFQSRMSEMMNILRKLPPVNEEKPVLVPGDLEKLRKEECLEQEGIFYSAAQMQSCAALAKRLGVRPLKEFEKYSAEEITTDGQTTS